MLHHARRFIGVAACLVLGACQQQVALHAEKISFSEVAGWAQDNQAEAMEAFAASCKAPLRTTSELQEMLEEKDWFAVCEQAQFLAAQSPGTEASRQFFEQHFTPYRLSFGAENQGLLTGYYSPEIEGSLTQTAEYHVPIYAPPADIEERSPYWSRSDIVSGALQGKGLEIAWAKDKVDVFFLHVQGSGYMHLPDGRRVLLQYAAGNHQPYTAIGKLLKDSGEIEEGAVSMQTIRAWLAAHPDKADELMNQNASYVFFNRVDNPTMPRGAQGVPLTPMRSLAVDSQYVPYGIPVFLDTQVAPQEQQQQALQRLMIAQDTGGAIRGAMRGDIFFGVGDQAGEWAGRQQFYGSWVVLLPHMQGGGHATQLAQQ